MTSETVPAQTDSAAPAAQPAAPQVPNLLQDLQSGAKNMKDLDGPSRKIAMDQIKASLSEADTVAAAAPDLEIKPAEVPKEPVAPAAEPAPEGKEKLQTPFDIKERRKHNQKLADEANRLEQSTAALVARQERARKAAEDAKKTEVAPPEDPWEKPHQDKLHTDNEILKKKIESLELRLNERDDEELKVSTTAAQQKREESLFESFHDLQEEYEPLKTTKPFKELNSMYAGWLDSELVAKSGVRETMPNASIEELRRAATEKYSKDPEFAKSIAPNPIPADDMQRFNTLLSLHHETNTIGGSLEGNWLARLKREGILEEVVQKGRKEAAVDAAQRTVQAINKANNAVQPVAPSDGGTRGYVDDEWNMARAAAAQKSLVLKHQSGQALTPAERETLKKVTAFLTNDFVGAAQ